MDLESSSPSQRLLPTKVEALIMGEIRSGRLKPGDRLGSARQLATKLDASYGAVRQSLEALAARGIVVRRPRAGTFISSNASPAAMANGDVATVATQNIIGLLLPDIRTPDAALVTRHMQDVCNAGGLEVLVSSTDNDGERFAQAIERHLQAKVRGLAMIAPEASKIPLELLVQLQNSGVPVVTYARSLGVGRWPVVQTDITHGMYIAMQHLCGLSRKRIAYLSYPSSLGSRESVGIYRALMEAGLSAENLVEYELPDTLYLQGNGWADNHLLCQVLTDWFDAHPDIDAVCCAHDHLAAAMLSVLKRKGRRVPDDVAVVGRGQMGEYFGLSSDDLTTVDTRVPAAAAKMFEILTRGETADTDSGDPILIRPQLVIGRSTVGASARTVSFE